MNTIKISINTTNNLLAFSAGVDSSALFFLLLQNNIPFDIAIVDYNQRDQSKDEVIYATQLAHKYNKKCYISTYPNNLKFSEKDARDFRYNFFDSIIKENNYNTLITAHQLNDKLEWFLMQLTKGAGVSELLGMQEKSYKNDYLVLKPLLNYSKEQLQTYLITHNHKFFEDASNQDEKYKRNYFRHTFSDKLIEKYQDGISKSFDYLEKDLDSLLLNIKKTQYNDLHIFKFNKDDNIAIRIIDKDLKQRGVIISSKTREEILKKREVVISHTICVSIFHDTIYIAPYLTVKLEKRFKEKCRIAKIPQNIRGYLSTVKDFTF